MLGPRFHRLLLGAGLAVWTIHALVLWLVGGPLGHDEAQYAIDVTDQLAGRPSRWGYLSRGMQAIALPGVLLGGSERALRFVPFLLSLVFIVIAWRLAQRVAGDGPAAWTVAVLAGTRSLVKVSGDLLSDLPSTTCLLGALLVIAGELEREDGPRWRLVLVAPLFAGAFYLRYGSALPIAIIVVGGVALGGRTLVRRPAPAIVAALAFGALLVPHLRQSLAETGSLLGILLESAGVPQERTAYFGAGLVTYLTSNPFALYGVPTPLPMLVGLVAIATGPRTVRLVALVGTADLVALGLTTHARTRYILLGVVLLVIAGCAVLHRLVAHRRAAGMAALAVVVASWWLVGAGMVRLRTRPSLRMAVALEAARVIRPDAAGRRCHVVAAGDTQLEWYTGCLSAPIAPADALARGEPYYVVRDALPGWQPDETSLPGPRTLLLERPGFVWITRYDGGGSPAGR